MYVRSVISREKSRCMAVGATVESTLRKGRWRWERESDGRTERSPFKQGVQCIVVGTAEKRETATELKCTAGHAFDALKPLVAGVDKESTVDGHGLCLRVTVARTTRQG
jgi:hypothetical protein